MVLSKACKVLGKPESYAAKPQGATETADNLYDTDETSLDIVERNAARKEFCKGIE